MPAKPYVYDGNGNWIGVGVADIATSVSGNSRDSLVYGEYKPDATNVGPNTGITLIQFGNSSGSTDFVVGTHTSPTQPSNIKGNGQIVENMEIWGRVNIVSYSNVIVKNCIIHGTLVRGTDTAHVIASGDNLRGALIIDCALVGRPAVTPSGLAWVASGVTNVSNEWSGGIRGGGYTLRRTEISNTQDAISFTSQVGNVTIEGCWIHNGAYQEWEDEDGSTGPNGNGYFAYTVGSSIPAKTLSNNVTVSSGSTTLTCPAGNFIAKEFRRKIIVNGAGPGGTNLSTYIANVNSATSVTLGTAASTSQTNTTATMIIRYTGLYTHCDGVQFHRGKNYRIVGNRIGGTRVPGAHNAAQVTPGASSDAANISSGDDFYNSAFMIKQEVDNSFANKIENVLIDKNWLTGGIATINMTLGNGNYFTSVTVSNNIFTRSTWGTQYYVLRQHDASNVYVGNFSNNVFEDDGSPIPISNGGTGTP